MAPRTRWHSSLIFVYIIYPVLGTIIGTLGYDLIKQYPVTSTFLNMIFWIGRLILSFLTFKVAVFWLLIGLLGIVLIIIFITYLSKSNAKPKFLSYTEGHFRNLKWSWTWELNSRDNIYDIKNIRPYCNSCDTNLVIQVDYSGNWLGAVCPRCDKEYNGRQMDHKTTIMALINDEVRKRGLENI